MSLETPGLGRYSLSLGTPILGGIRQQSEQVDPSFLWGAGAQGKGKTHSHHWRPSQNEEMWPRPWGV